MKPPLIIAELSANHQQDLQIAKDSIYAIAKSGADGVKLQTYTPSCLTLDSKIRPLLLAAGHYGIILICMICINKPKRRGNGTKSFFHLHEV